MHSQITSRVDEVSSQSSTPDGDPIELTPEDINRIALEVIKFFKTFIFYFNFILLFIIFVNLLFLIFLYQLIGFFQVLPRKKGKAVCTGSLQLGEPGVPICPVSSQHDPVLKAQLDQAKAEIVRQNERIGQLENGNRCYDMLFDYVSNTDENFRRLIANARAATATAAGASTQQSADQTNPDNV